VSHELLIKGRHCIFDYSAQSDARDRAQNLLVYFDEKVPLLFSYLQLELPQIPISIYFTKDKMTFSSYENMKITYSVKNSINDLGCLIHEAVHLAQGYKSYFSNADIKFLAEGMADYCRIKFSNDRWDNPDERNPFPYRGFCGYGCSKCGAEFFVFLEEIVGNSDFIVHLNKLLKTDNTKYNDIVNGFFHKDLHELIGEFIEYKDKRT